VNQGKFITLEGMEGVGKSSHIGLVVEMLQSRGIDAVATREPGGTRLGERIRELLLNQDDLPAIHADAELLLIFAARAEHLQQLILPALSAGRWVVCDRFTDASYAYQGAGRGITHERIAALEHWTQGALRPHLTLLLDSKVETALARMRARGARNQDRYERETIEFFVRVRDGYRKLAARQPHRFKIINADGSLDYVRRQIVTACKTFLSSNS
jgi:dTMP kinase